MARRITVFGMAAIAAGLFSSGTYLYSQGVPYDPGSGNRVVQAEPKQRKIPGKYCKTVTRPPDTINMCLRSSEYPHEDCTNYCVKVTLSGKYCDDDPNSTCNATEEKRKITIEAAECFVRIVGCKCRDDFWRREIEIKWLTCR
ncbi:hypothetical protein [Fischerella thermalis]|uniref:Uncharacterized protein n=1 Tax=Fischerella thermalis CCMEE 5318 TaxID=2019666 RepID=A0A2N6L5W2_9CYAN|nr:hypothetical protein [Fischerella thermalis]PMB17266.1 hypothetical protein CEN46_23950 [Fischerella thermalis CCMEE 5318]